jgi:putative ABC transport system permease protein
MYNQLNYIQTKKLGFEKEQLVCVHNLFNFGKKAHTLKKEISNHPAILNASVSSHLPVFPCAGKVYNYFAPDGEKEAQIKFNQWFIDDDYIETLKMEFLEGRNFSEEFWSDSKAVIVNEATLKDFGWKSAEGHFISQGGGSEYKIIGVLKNFHYESLKESIHPMIMMLGENGYYLIVRYNKNQTKQVLEFLQQKWKEFAPNLPFEYSFIDERFNAMYFQEQRLGKIMGIFTGLAIVIAALGLFGLAAFIAEKRTKEIAIRKVNGASIMSIFLLFAKDIAKLIAIAFILAVPLTWYAIDNWLNNFAYRTNISWMVFLGAGALAFIIAILTIFHQAYLASARNPVESLKYE